MSFKGEDWRREMQKHAEWAQNHKRKQLADEIARMIIDDAVEEMREADEK